LRDGSRRFPQTSTYSAVLGNAHEGANAISPTGFSPSMILLSKRFGYHIGFLLPDLHANWSVLAPQHQRYNGCVLYCINWFRLFPVRSSLLGKSLLLFLPRGTEIFQFPPFALSRICILREVPEYDLRRVASFGDRRVKGCFHLSDAYRR
jgi:hypothetical protein